jgi:hypothetical protein
MRWLAMLRDLDHSIRHPRSAVEKIHGALRTGPKTSEVVLAKALSWGDYTAHRFPPKGFALTAWGPQTPITKRPAETAGTKK